jgi:hypothetical protein
MNKKEDKKLCITFSKNKIKSVLSVFAKATIPNLRTSGFPLLNIRKLQLSVGQQGKNLVKKSMETGNVIFNTVIEEDEPWEQNELT